MGVHIPVSYSGQSESARGPLLLVMWENFTDAILTGREELGYAKVFADLPQPTMRDGGRSYTASWWGHQFFSMDIDELIPAPTPTPRPAAIDGVLHYRYFPAVNDTESADVSQVTITPPDATPTIESYHRGTGSARFIPSSWEQMPTQHQIVNALAALPVIEPRGATLALLRGAKDLSDVRVLS